MGKKNKSNQKDSRSIYKKMALIGVVTVILAGVLFLTDNKESLWKTASQMESVKRNPPGGGKRKEELQVNIGENKDNMTIEIAEEELSKQEIQEVFQSAQEELEEAILGDNESLEEVRSDLKLVRVLPGSGVRVDWELDSYKCMNLQGELQEKALPDMGEVVQLNAFLSYKDENIQYTFYAHVYPPKRTKEEALMKKLELEIEKEDLKSRENSEMLLPVSVEGQEVRWSPTMNYRATAIGLLGIALALMIYVSEKEKEKERLKYRRKQLEMDYAQVISCFALYIGAGMTVRMAWFKLAKEYENRKKKEEPRAAYEEMLYTMHEIQSGASENECYERFGERCGLSIYRKFGVLLSQNLKKGTKGLTELLKQESVEAFEKRKIFAKMQGEEAGTKILLPMFMMLGVVLIMIVFPAFFSIQV